MGAQAGPTLDTSLGLAPGKHWQTLSTPRGRVGGHPGRSRWAASWQTLERQGQPLIPKGLGRGVKGARIHS